MSESPHPKIDKLDLRTETVKRREWWAARKRTMTINQRARDRLKTWTDALPTLWDNDDLEKQAMRNVFRLRRFLGLPPEPSH